MLATLLRQEMALIRVDLVGTRKRGKFLIRRLVVQSLSLDKILNPKLPLMADPSVYV